MEISYHVVSQVSEEWRHAAGAGVGLYGDQDKIPGLVVFLVTQYSHHCIAVRPLVGLSPRLLFWR